MTPAGGLEPPTPLIAGVVAWAVSSIASVLLSVVVVSVFGVAVLVAAAAAR